MPSPFEFATATRIVFGRGRVSDLGTLTRGFGDRVLFVTGSTPARAAAAAASLQAAGIELVPFLVPGEPDVVLVLEGVECARDAGCRWVLSCGGGSVIDAGKAIAALVTNRRDLLDYLEIVGLGMPLTETPLPFVALPTTAGTGAEVTRNAVLAVPEHRVKVSLRSPLMLPGLAVVDSDLTIGLPRHLTATTGLDALTQLIEPFVSIKANPITDALCRDGILRFGRSFPKVLNDGSDATAREDIALASLFGGLALANAGLGAVHGFAGPIGGMFPAPHGAICAALLAPVFAANRNRLRQHSPQSATLDRFTEVAQCLIGTNAATADDGIEWIQRHVATAGIPGLRHWGITENDFEAIAAKATVAGSMKGNPVVFSRNELVNLLRAAL
jgi:alcohol dehydrogenase class IV